MEKGRDFMLLHFLNEYSVLGRVGDRIRISGVFPGIQENDHVYLTNEEVIDDGEERRYRIERIEYAFGSDEGSFGAIIVRE